MTELEARIDAPLTENPWRRGPTFRPRISFAWHHVRIVSLPGPSRFERWLERVWPNNPLTQFNRRARNAEQQAWWKTVWR